VLLYASLLGLPPSSRPRLPAPPPAQAVPTRHSSASMAIAVCSHCGGLVIRHETMCHHCGQRGRARMSRQGTLVFGPSRRRFPREVRRFLVVMTVGMVAAGSLALASLTRPVREEGDLHKLMIQCENIRQARANSAEHAVCASRVARLRAAERR
jgi:hypothetical protein